MDVVPQSTGCNHNDEEKQRQLADVPINDVKHVYMRTSSRVGTSISSAASSSAHDTSIINSMRRQSTAYNITTNKGVEDTVGNDSQTNAFKLALQNVCINSFGIIAVDVWLHDENDGRFSQIGYDRHYMYKPTDAAKEYALARLEDVSRKDYVQPQTVIPGTGLAGYFWSICSNHDRTNTWRDIRAITSDPDQPSYLRMSLLEKAGYGKACGITFDIRGHRGVVVFLARENADQTQLSDLANEIHLRVSADLIGAISAFAITSDASINAKMIRTATTLRRIRAKMLAFVAFTSLFKRTSHNTGFHHITTKEDEENNVKQPALMKRLSQSFHQARVSKTYRESIFPAMRRSYRQSMLKDAVDGVKRKGKLLIQKSKGGNMQPPPAMPLVQSIWVFAGAFTTMMILSAVSVSLNDAMGKNYIIWGPLGALMTLQYGLTPAPASQPRNALYGQIISISIALVVNLIISAGSSLRVPLTVALAVSAMCKLGIIHPPAGAAAAIFASSDSFDVVFLGFMIVGNLVAIGMAILVNNLNYKKQYPVYYEFVSDRWKKRVVNTFQRCFPCKKKIER